MPKRESPLRDAQDLRALPRERRGGRLAVAGCGRVAAALAADLRHDPVHDGDGLHRRHLRRTAHGLKRGARFMKKKKGGKKRRKSREKKAEKKEKSNRTSN